MAYSQLFIISHPESTADIAATVELLQHLELRILQLDALVDTHVEATADLQTDFDPLWHIRYEVSKYNCVTGASLYSAWPKLLRCDPAAKFIVPWDHTVEASAELAAAIKIAPSRFLLLSEFSTKESKLSAISAFISSIIPVPEELPKQEPARPKAIVPRILPNPGSSADDFAVIACYWNPAGWQSIRRNYQRFIHEMAWWRVPLFTAEIAYAGQSWASRATTFKIRGRTRNLLWQKERLLNYIVERLPANYTKIAWIDADILFIDPFWVEKVKATLDEYPVVQLWDRWHCAGPNGEIAETLTSVGHMAQRYKDKKTWTPGGAWAAQREVFPLYDRHVVGSGDAMCLEGWLGLEYSRTMHQFTDAMKNDFIKWSELAYQKVQGRITSMPFDTVHLYHGTRKDRRYTERWKPIVSAKFDPQKHVHVDKAGLLAWTPDAPTELRKYVKKYFKDRNEDDYSKEYEST